MDPRTAEPPFPDACRTGRAFVTSCCTSSIREFEFDGVLYLASRVAGHGWSTPWQGRIEDINDTGILVEKDGRAADPLACRPGGGMTWQPKR